MSDHSMRQVVKSINANTPWEKWDQDCRILLCAAFYPAMMLNPDQKGASAVQWESLRLMRHLFNRSTLPVPDFIVRQWSAVPRHQRQQWMYEGAQLRSMILEHTAPRSKLIHPV